MIEEGRRRPGGDAPNLRWIVGAAETAPLGGPYALVTAGRGDALDALAGDVRAAGGGDDRRRAAGDRRARSPRTRPGSTEIIVRYSRSPDYDPDSGWWTRSPQAGLFEPVGEATTAPTPFRQRTEDYIEYLHSTSSLAREWMEPAEAAAFDREVAEAVAPFATDGWLDLPVTARFSWGTSARRLTSVAAQPDEELVQFLVGRGERRGDDERVAAGAVDAAAGRVDDQPAVGRGGDRLGGHVEAGSGGAAVAGSATNSRPHM